MSLKVRLDERRGPGCAFRRAVTHEVQGHKQSKSLEATRMVRRHSASVRQSTLLLTATVLSACGGHTVNSGSKHGSSDANASEPELVEVPPRGYYDALVANIAPMMF